MSSAGILNLPITSLPVDNFHDRALWCKSTGINYNMHGWILYRYCATGWFWWISGLRAVTMWSSSSFTKTNLHWFLLHYYPVAHGFLHRHVLKQLYKIRLEMPNFQMMSCRLHPTVPQTSSCTWQYMAYVPWLVFLTEIWMKNQIGNFQDNLNFSDWWLRYLLWNCAQVVVNGPHWLS